MHETWAAMEAAVDAGLVRHLGVSNFSAKKLRELLPHCRIKPEVNQVELHPLLQQKELVAYCTAQGIHVTAYAPLGSGDRPAFVKAPDAPVLLDNPVIRSIAEAHERTSAQVLLAWHVQRGISAIPKSVTPARLRENLAGRRAHAHPDRARTHRRARPRLSHDRRHVLGCSGHPLDASDDLGRTVGAGQLPAQVSP